MKLKYISIDEKIVDFLSKPLSKEMFIYFKDKLGVMENTSLNEREC